MAPNQEELREWLMGRLPANVAASDPEVTLDDDEILIMLTLNTSGLTGDGPAREKAERELIELRRNETKALRVQLGRKLGRAFGAPVSWAMRAGTSEEYFTNNTAPVMTRLSRDERHVLDTLIATGVAETRSGALGYIVRTFSAEHAEWLKEVQETMSKMSSLRDKLQPEKRSGPPPGATTPSGEADA